MKYNRGNKQELYKPKDFCASVRDGIYLQNTLGTNQNFMTSSLTKNFYKELCSYVNATCAMSAMTAYMHICYKTNFHKIFVGVL